jgi:hypothetical protein
VWCSQEHDRSCVLADTARVLAPLCLRVRRKYQCLQELVIIVYSRTEDQIPSYKKSTEDVSDKDQRAVPRDFSVHLLHFIYFELADD